MYSNKRQILEALDAIREDPSLPSVKVADCRPGAALKLMSDGMVLVDGANLKDTRPRS